MVKRFLLKECSYVFTHCEGHVICLLIFADLPIWVWIWRLFRHHDKEPLLECESVISIKDMGTYVRNLVLARSPKMGWIILRSDAVQGFMDLYRLCNLCIARRHLCFSLSQQSHIGFRDKRYVLFKGCTLPIVPWPSQSNMKMCFLNANPLYISFIGQNKAAPSTPMFDLIIQKWICVKY